MRPQDLPTNAPPRLVENVRDVRRRIREAALRSGRAPAGIRLVAVTKTMPPEITPLLPAAGIADVGENRVDGAERKTALGVPGLKWHMIGHLQRNKARRALGLFDLVHSVDSDRLIGQLDRLAGEAGRTAEVLVQVNISDEPQKHGVSPDGLRELLAAAVAAEHVQVRGLMGMGAFVPDAEEVRPSFRMLRELRDEATRGGWYREPLDELSMGMTNDFEVAVEEGATLVRVGTALFGGVSVRPRERPEED
jgi:pyridoxal phosphate enzyme (YggS family)